MNVRGGGAGIPDHQVGVDGDQMIRHRLAIDARQQPGDGKAAQLLFRLIDGGERRRHEFGQRHVVIADDGEIARDHQPRLMSGADGPHRHHVVAHEQRAGALGQRQQAGHRLVAAGAVEVTLLDPLWVDGEPGLLHRLLEARLTLVGGGAAVGACDAADGGVTQPQQVAGRQVAAAMGVVGDEVHVGALHPPVHHHHRQALEPVELVEHLLLPLAAHDEQAVDPLAQHHA